jgi:hypothetical protein
MTDQEQTSVEGPSWIGVKASQRTRRVGDNVDVKDVDYIKVVEG